MKAWESTLGLWNQHPLHRKNQQYSAFVVFSLKVWFSSIIYICRYRMNSYFEKLLKIIEKVFNRFLNEKYFVKYVSNKIIGCLLWIWESTLLSHECWPKFCETTTKVTPSNKKIIGRELSMNTHEKEKLGKKKKNMIVIEKCEFNIFYIYNRY